MNAQTMVLVDTSHKLPMPGTQRLFSAAGETVDMHDPFWRNLALDGSIKPAPVAAPVETPPPPVTPLSDPEAAALEAAEDAAASAASLIEKLRHPQA